MDYTTTSAAAKRELMRTTRNGIKSMVMEIDGGEDNYGFPVTAALRGSA